VARTKGRKDAGSKRCLGINIVLRDYSRAWRIDVVPVRREAGRAAHGPVYSTGRELTVTGVVEEGALL
jgi:hypothetical protein